MYTEDGIQFRLSDLDDMTTGGQETAWLTSAWMTNLLATERSSSLEKKGKIRYWPVGTKVVRIDHRFL